MIGVFQGSKLRCDVDRVTNTNNMALSHPLEELIGGGTRMIRDSIKWNGLSYENRFDSKEKEEPLISANGR